MPWDLYVCVVLVAGRPAARSVDLFMSLENDMKQHMQDTIIDHERITTGKEIGKGVCTRARSLWNVWALEQGHW